ncbi:uncharacterized protein LOC118423287 [Branchiostoma floridae]|uniref:Uncharacterized protein LOC118423287 n=1 Tax=Branchiostoma floridae TaxID=7739 RepID=A0A9J7LRC9_BRAFL|nr:uncharacterized protein LOC118423287 [Branchiostoma floridae]
MDGRGYGVYGRPLHEAVPVWPHFTLPTLTGPSNLSLSGPSPLAGPQSHNYNLTPSRPSALTGLQQHAVPTASGPSSLAGPQSHNYNLTPSRPSALTGLQQHAVPTASGPSSLAGPQSHNYNLTPSRPSALTGLQQHAVPTASGPSSLAGPQQPVSHSSYFSLLHNNTLLQGRIQKMEEEKKALRSQLLEISSLNHSAMWEHVNVELNQEMVRITNSRSLLCSNIQTVSDIQKLSITDARVFLTSNAPRLYHLISSLMSRPFQDNDGHSAVMLLSSIANARNQKCSALQKVIALYLLLTSSQSQTVQMLNHTHQCVSITTAWKVIEDFAEMKKVEQKPAEVTEVWVYDNINLMKRVRHVRKGHHAEMLNWTTRLVLPVRSLPPDDLGDDPQGLRQDLSEVDILPTEEDVEELKTRFKERVIRLLVSKFKAFRHFDTSHAQTKRVKKSEFTPLEVLDLDEAKASDNIQILLQCAKDRGVGNDVKAQVVFGDQATCKNIRGAKRLRQTEDSNIESLDWVKETPGDFHFLLEAGRTTLMAFWTSPRNVGSLGHLRDLVDRRSVDTLGKNFNATDEFLHHCEEAHLTAALLTHLKMDTIDDDFHVDGITQLDDLAVEFVESLTAKPHAQHHDDGLFNLNHRLLFHLLLYTDLRMVIRNENGPAIIQHWKFWLLLFVGTGRGNYSYEAINLIANLQADWSPKTAWLATHNRTVNCHGTSGHGKAIDMMNEHYNRDFKSMMRGSGSKVTIAHAKQVSLAIPLLQAARRFCVGAFGVKRTSSHTVKSATVDIDNMVRAIQEARVYTPQEGRRISLGKRYDDPIIKAFQKINDDKWLAKSLLKWTRKHIPEMDEIEVDIEALMDE